MTLPAPPGPPTEPGPPAPPPAYAAYPAPAGAPAYYGTPVRSFEPPPSKSMAGWALGLAVVPCLLGVSTLVGIGLAITVLVRSRDGRDHGKGLAVAALVVGCAWVLVGVVTVAAALVGGLEVTDEEAPLTSPGGDRAVQALEVGDCFNSPALQGVGPDTTVETDSVSSMPCAAPHSFEAYHRSDLVGGDYPGEDEVIAQADAACRKAFRGFVGTTYRRSELDVTYLFPTVTSWRDEDDRRVLCLISDGDTRVTGSLRDARR